jgi:mono/diheme cytochrome c family protein
MRRSLLGIALSSLFAASSLLALQTPAQGVADGVYTDQQAARGQAVYTARCASCHAPNLSGRTGPPLTGADFLANWNTQPLLELANKIGRTMPKDDTPRLTSQETADLLAYILQVGKFPGGRAELRMDETALKQLNFPAPQTRPVTNPSQVTSLPPVGTVAAVMRGILFPSANIIFTVQSIDPGEKRAPTDENRAGGIDWLIWGGNIYKGWDSVDYAAVSVGESAQLMLTPGRRCENGKVAPINDPAWIKFTMELADAGKAALKAAQTRKQDVASDATNQLNDSCQNCHSVYRGRVHCVKP